MNNVYRRMCIVNYLGVSTFGMLKLWSYYVLEKCSMRNPPNLSRSSDCPSVDRTVIAYAMAFWRIMPVQTSQVAKHFTRPDISDKEIRCRAQVKSFVNPGI